MSIPNPLYTTPESVKARLAGKVQFQKENAEPAKGEVPTNLLLQLINDAEVDVELELMGRYAVPFRSITTSTFIGLPDHSKRAIRTVVDDKAVMNILGTDFGRGSHINGAEYAKSTADNYEKRITLLMGQDKEGKERDRFKHTPPLSDLMLAATNRADTGMRGRVINSDGSDNSAAEYAGEQINNPDNTFVGRRTIGVV